MSLASPFASSKLRVARAKAQIDDLDGRLRAFFASVANIEYPELNIWMTAQARRIRMQRQIIEGYRQQIAHLVQRLRDNNK